MLKYQLGIILKGLIVLSVFLVQNSIMNNIDHNTIGARWYEIQVLFEIILIFVSFALAQLRMELSIILSLGIVANLVTYEDYLTGSNNLYDWYPDIMTSLYYAALLAFAFYFTRLIFKLIKTILGELRCRNLDHPVLRD